MAATTNNDGGNAPPKHDDENEAAVMDVEALLPELRQELNQAQNSSSNNNHKVSDETLLKFLRWKQSVPRATERFQAHVKWRKEYPFAFDDTPLQATQDAQLKRLLAGNVLIAPDDLTDKDGAPVLVGRLRNNDMKDGRSVQDVCRMIFYMIDRILERRHGQELGVTIFHDMTGVSRHNVDPGIPKLLFYAIVGHFPIRIRQVLIYKAPWFIHPIFALLSTLFLPSKLRQRIHFINNMDAVYEAIDKDQLLKEHGGNREFDATEWVEQQCQREQQEGAFTSLQDCYVKDVGDTNEDTTTNSQMPQC